DAVAQPVRQLAQPLVVETVDAGGEHGDAVHAPRIGEDVARGAARELALQLGDALLLFAQLGEELLELAARLALAGPEQLREVGQERLVSPHPGDGALPGRCLDAAHAGGDPALAVEAEETDIAGARHVRATAQLGGELAHPYTTHAVTVLGAEEVERTHIA